MSVVASGDMGVEFQEKKGGGVTGESGAETLCVMLVFGPEELLLL